MGFNQTGWTAPFRKKSPSHYYRAGESFSICGRVWCASGERSPICPGYKCESCKLYLEATAHVGGAKREGDSSGQSNTEAEADTEAEGKEEGNGKAARQTTVPGP